mmetsp:Transcript_11139/g.31325  ORF Transcript_11139/g.31325 Transcript_11139/m.31325 type:complete len:385 (+) Transcript_11139:68-1222(+)
MCIRNPAVWLLSVIICLCYVGRSAAAGDCQTCDDPRAVQGASVLQVKSKRTKRIATTPSELMTCPGGAIPTTLNMTEETYEAVAASVVDLLLSLDAACDASSCQQADWAGCVLRMAGHDFMDFKDGQGGSDACTDMTHLDNTGLLECLATGEHGVSLLQAYQLHCTAVSLADFLVIAAEAIMSASRPQADLDFKATFKYGRTTSDDCDGAADLLPNPLRGCPAVEETFLQNMGLTWRGAAALMGVHSLGRAKIENSGFHGWWSDPVNSRIFNNNYYVSIMAKGWVPETSIGDVSFKSQWGRSDSGQDTSFDGHEMMLNTDMCLAYTEDQVPVNSLDHTCCAWVTFQTGGSRCGNRGQCCGQERNDCGDRRGGGGGAPRAPRDSR